MENAKTDGGSGTESGKVSLQQSGQTEALLPEVQLLWRRTLQLQDHAADAVGSHSM